MKPLMTRKKTFIIAVFILRYGLSAVSLNMLLSALAIEVGLYFVGVMGVDRRSDKQWLVSRRIIVIPLKRSITIADCCCWTMYKYRQDESNDHWLVGRLIIVFHPSLPDDLSFVTNHDHCLVAGGMKMFFLLSLSWFVIEDKVWRVNKWKSWSTILLLLW